MDDSNNSEKSLDIITQSVDGKDEKLLRRHSPTPLIDSIFNIGHGGLCQISLIGSQSNHDKTVTSNWLSQEIKKKETEKFLIRSFDGDDYILNFKETLKSLPEENHILKFNNISCIMTKYNHQKRLNMCKDFTEINHIKDKPIKFYIIIDVPTTKSLPKYIRGGDDVTLYYDIPQHEINNVKKMGFDAVKTKKFSKLLENIMVTKNHKFKIKYGGNKYFEYTYKKPFIPILSNYGVKTRMIMVPYSKTD